MFFFGTLRVQSALLYENRILKVNNSTRLTGVANTDILDIFTNTQQSKE